jgi:uncharacterized membrane protein
VADGARQCKRPGSNTYLFNHQFEAWETCEAKSRRTAQRRAVHAPLLHGLQAGIFIPLTAWWLSFCLWQAFPLERALVAVFIAFSYGFA